MTNKSLISRDSVIEILKKEIKFNQENDLSGEYGKGVLFALQSFIKYINSLPTFSPEAIIEEMIEDIKRNFPDNKKYTKFGEGLITGKIDSLEMLKHRLRAENIS